MATVLSVQDGYWNETGTFSAAVTNSLSAVIATTVMLDPAHTMSCASITYASTAGSRGVLGVPSGQRAKVSIASKVYEFVSVGGVIKGSGSPRSIPAGQKA